ncbi:MAG: ATPase, T2SS/T4P/T4SS family [Planctomycetota bacterium]
MDATSLLNAAAPAVLLAETTPFVLVSWWKALLVVATFAGWAWFISTVADKHAARFYLPREQWNLAYMVTGLLAIAVILANPVHSIWGFFVAWPVAVLLLAVPPLVYVQKANSDERVPEEHRITLNISQWAAERKVAKEARKAGRVELAIVKPDGVTLQPPEQETPEFVVRTTAEKVYIDGVSARAQKIELLPAGDKGYAVAHTVDGVRTVVGEPMAPAEAMRVIAFWQTASGLEAGERRRQVGEPDVSRDGDRHHLRVITSGGQQGLKMTIVVDPAKSVRRTPENLGLLPMQMQLMEELAGEGSGVVLLAAPRGMGRTTQLYTALKLHDAYTSNIQTLELEPQDTLEGIRQNVWSPTADAADHGTMLRSIIRRDPDVVGVAELLDEGTANEIARGDTQTTRVYASLAADSAVVAVAKYVQVVGDPAAAAASLKGVLAGKLVRRLAETSREAYVPSPDMLKKLGLSADKVGTLYRHREMVEVNKKVVPCPESGGTGYVGQIGVFEVFRIGDEERGLIERNELQQLGAAFRKQGLPTIQQAAIARLVEGVTDVDEVVRVTVPAKKPQAAKPAPAPA